MVKGAQKKTGGDSGPGTPQKKSRSYKTGTGGPGVRHKNTKSSQQVDIYETKVDDIVVVVCSKPNDAPEASFTHWHQTKLFEQWGADTLVIAALPRRAKGGLHASVGGKSIMKQKPNGHTTGFAS